MRALNAKGELTEAAWQAQVVGLALFYGWLVYHPPANRPDAKGRRQDVTPGYPDLTMVRGAELLFVELKAERGRYGPGQETWLEALQEVARSYRNALELLAEEVADGGPDPLAGTVEVYTWRPSQFDEVQARLARGRTIVPSVNR